MKAQTESIMVWQNSSFLSGQNSITCNYSLQRKKEMAKHTTLLLHKLYPVDCVAAQGLPECNIGRLVTKEIGYHDILTVISEHKRNVLFVISVNLRAPTRILVTTQDDLCVCQSPSYTTRRDNVQKFNSMDFS